MSEERRIHVRVPDPLAVSRRFRQRGPQPAVSNVTTTERQSGELDLQKLAAAAALEVLAAERKGRPLIVRNTIANPALKALATQARRDLARMNANQRADHHRVLEE